MFTDMLPSLRAQGAIRSATAWVVVPFPSLSSPTTASSGTCLSTRQASSSDPTGIWICVFRGASVALRAAAVPGALRRFGRCPVHRLGVPAPLAQVAPLRLDVRPVLLGFVEPPYLGLPCLLLGPPACGLGDLDQLVLVGLTCLGQGIGGPVLSTARRSIPPSRRPRALRRALSFFPTRPSSVRAAPLPRRSVSSGRPLLASPRPVVALGHHAPGPDLRQYLRVRVLADATCGI